MHLLTALALLTLPGLASAEDAPRRGWTYTVRVAPDLSRFRVRVCFRGFVPQRLILAHNDGLSAIKVAPRRDG